MQDAGILDGDLAIVDRQIEPSNGQLGNEMRIVSKNTTDHYIFTDVNQVEAR